MLRFIGDLFIGWVIFTDTGKKTINKAMNVAFNKVKSNVLKSPQFQDILSMKDIFLNDEELKDDKQSNNRTKN